MANVDIVARLQLRADQFSSETGARFAELKTRAKSTAQEIRSSFTSSLADVQKVASQALTLPRTSTGALDLSGEIASLRQAAVASEAKAAAARELQQAFLAAATAGQGNVEVLRQDADAAMVAAAAEDRLANELRQRVLAMEAVQGHLKESVVQTRQLSVAGEEHIVSAGQQRAAMQNLGFQFQDFAVQVVSGQSALVAFAQQMPQAAGALGGFGGQIGRIGAALSSFGGIAATVAVVALTPLVAKLLEQNRALDDSVEKMKKDARESETNRRAKNLFQRSVEGITQALREQKEAQEAAINSSRTAAEVDNIRAKNLLELSVNARRVVVAELERAEAEFKSSQSILNQSGGAAQQIYGRRLGEAQRAAEQARKNLARAELDQRQSLIDLAAEQAKREADPIAKINKLYDDRVAALKKVQKAEVEKTGVVQRGYREQFDAIERARKADVDAEQERQRTANRRGRTVSIGNQLESERGADILAAAQRYMGAREDTKAGKATLKDLFSTAGINVDPEKVAWCAAFVNAVLSGQGIRGTGSLAARSFLGFGENTDNPNKGDVVVLRRGNNAAQGHVGFYAGTDRSGRVLVTGGNQGGSVSTQAFARKDVLGFRRAPTAAESYKADEEAAKRLAEEAERARDAVERINITWDEQPRLIDRARLDAARLNDIIAEYEGKPDEASKAIVTAARASIGVIEQGLDRPYQLFLRSQREGLAIQQLILAGRDVEAAALQDAIRLQESGQALDDRRLANLYAMAEQQRAISIALEDQRRIVGAYVGTVGDLQRTFDDFMVNVERKPGRALEQLLTGTAESFKQLQRNLLSDSIFGGLDRKVEEYVRRRTGGTTPADMLREQLGQAGRVLDGHVDQTGAALDDFVTMVRRTTEALGIATSRGVSSPAGPSLLPDGLSDDLIDALSNRPATGLAANDNEGAELVVTASRSVAHAANTLGDKAGLAGIIVDHFADRLGRLGIEVPKNITNALKTHLPTVIDGLNVGQSAGSIFAGITGGKDDKLASGVGGILGNVAGKALGKPIAAAIGGSLGKTLGGAAGPLGSIVGGIAGNLVGSLFRSNKYGSATVSFGQYGEAIAGSGMGRGQDQTRAASGSARSVAQGVNRIAEQLGATITGLPGITIGNWDGKARVALTSTNKALHSNNFSSAVLKDFGKDGEQEAIEYAIRYSISNAVINGISQASKNIIARGANDLDSAIQKAVLIESVPKALKERLDPVGAAIDVVELRFKRIFDTMKEGGATAEQIAQAQQLYNLELADAKTKTNTAAASLKQFLDGLRAGNASPLSLRDQQISARAALQPFLDQINAGQAIDQDKYQSAAQTFLDVERQLYGSTNAFFVEFDRIQKATAKAIERIDGVSPLPSSDALARATAESVAKTATGIQTGNEMAEQTNTLLARLVDLNRELLERSSVDRGNFMGSARLFRSDAA